MDRVLSDAIVTARKHYPCDASHWWIRSGYTLADCDNDDQRLIVEAAIADNFKILPGQAYRKATGVQDGEIVTYRARIGMDSVIRALELVDD